MKLITVDDFLAWHNNAGGFLSYPVIVQLDNDPSNGRELSLYFFSCLEGGAQSGMYNYQVRNAESGMYNYQVRNAARKQDLDLSKMIVVGFRPIMVKDTEFFKTLGVDVSSGFVMLVKAYPIEVFEGEENDRK